MPNLILSVNDGSKGFNVPLKIKKAFKRGLIKAALNTGAWIVTGGGNMGIAKLVGEAVADETHKESLTVIGIANWGCLALRDRMIEKAGVWE